MQLCKKFRLRQFLDLTRIYQYNYPKLQFAEFFCIFELTRNSVLKVFLWSNFPHKMCRYARVKDVSRCSDVMTSFGVCVII